ncbi:MAG: hypothetical protein AVDCRST_MAG49-1356 [uncultured Thermomicrobiales bacterium]|uniref:Uncharacterized protein n=1 Tax=uncultured Thermomicrobiales bacterium TaxID=1645740 RepID=A0A6J4UEG6_9BACT|nr:MAG: hypothetical protein AVDCRST_MAG49-1356 [uncultured Thermomicrobiales bacterium]
MAGRCMVLRIDVSGVRWVSWGRRGGTWGRPRSGVRAGHCREPGPPTET